MDREATGVLRDVVDALDALSIRYAIGGSVASSLYGEPRSTHDIDILLQLGAGDVDTLVARLESDYVVFPDAVRSAVVHSSSFQALHKRYFFKVDLFVAGTGILDREQLEHRRFQQLPNVREEPIAVTAPENIVLRKLDWFRLGDEVSDRQWRDILGVLRIRGPDLDLDYMRDVSRRAGLHALLERALSESGLAKG